MPVPTGALDSCSWLIEVKHNVIFCCCSQSLSILYVSWVLWCKAKPLSFSLRCLRWSPQVVTQRQCNTLGECVCLAYEVFPAHDSKTKACVQGLPRVSQYPLDARLPPGDTVSQDVSPEGTEPDAMDWSGGNPQRVKGRGCQQPGPSTFPGAHSPPSPPDTAAVRPYARSWGVPKPCRQELHQLLSHVTGATIRDNGSMVSGVVFDRVHIRNRPLYFFNLGGK